MRRLVCSLLLPAWLCACQDPAAETDRAQLETACVEAGEARETCRCLVDVMHEGLPDGLFARVVSSVGVDGQPLQPFLEALAFEEQLAFADILEDMMSCLPEGRPD